MMHFNIRPFPKQSYEHRSVKRADRRADDQIGLHTAVEERVQHADLRRARVTAATEHECHPPRHRASLKGGRGDADETGESASAVVDRGDIPK